MSLRADQVHDPLPGVSVLECIAIGALIQATLDGRSWVGFLARRIRRAWS